MRMAFGLIGVLVTIGVVVWLMSAFYLPHTQTVLKAQKDITPQVEQISGHTRDGVKASDTITLDGENSGGRFNSVVVTSIVPGGAMQSYFGLQKGDSII